MSKAKKQSLYQEVTDLMIAKIESGDLISWDSGVIGGGGYPRNAMTGKAYRGINVWLGWLSGGGETDFMTSKQAASCRETNPSAPNFIGYQWADNSATELADDGHPVGVKRYTEKGAKKASSGTKAGDPIFQSAFRSWDEAKDRGITMVRWVVKDDDRDENGRQVMFPVRFKVYPMSVFRSDCFRVDRVAALRDRDLINSIDHSNKASEIERCEALIASYCSGSGKGPKLVHGSFECGSYVPRLDEIRSPDTYASQIRKLKTILHECIHSTGHESRLSRRGITDLGAFGDHEYSKEELIAELGAAMLSALVGFLPEVEDTSAAYLKGWLSVLKAEPKMLLQSAAQAQRAVDYITGAEWDEDRGEWTGGALAG